MSLMPIEEIIKRDPHVDPIDVTRLMFDFVKRGIVAGPPKPKELAKDIGYLIDEGPVAGIAGLLLLIGTVPIGGIAEGAVRTYRAWKEKRE